MIYRLLMKAIQRVLAHSTWSLTYLLATSYVSVVHLSQWVNDIKYIHVNGSLHSIQIPSFSPNVFVSSSIPLRTPPHISECGVHRLLLVVTAAPTFLAFHGLKGLGSTREVFGSTLLCWDFFAWLDWDYTFLVEGHRCAAPITPYQGFIHTITRTHHCH